MLMSVTCFIKAQFVCARANGMTICVAVAWILNPILVWYDRLLATTKASDLSSDLHM